VVPQPFATHPIDQFDHGNTLTLPPRRVNQKLLNLGPKQEAYFTRLHYRDDNDPFMDDSTDGCSFFAELNNTRRKNISRLSTSGSGFDKDVHHPTFVLFTKAPIILVQL
jgi:hypothetical protein